MYDIIRKVRLGKLYAPPRDTGLKKKDLILIGAVLLLAALTFVGYRLWGGGAQPKAEVVIYLDGSVYRRVPLQPQTIVIDQGSGRTNTIEVRADGVRMRSASCPKQECIEQGEVTLNNHTTRPLGNWIICLPNKVSVELVVAGE